MFTRALTREGAPTEASGAVTGGSRVTAVSSLPRRERRTGSIEGAASEVGRPARPTAGVRPSAAGRLLFVDNIRVFLTILVILHHLTITYAGTGGWLYKEGRQDAVVDALGGWFCSVNQAYFMGLFLLISAYFVPGSYDRKGPGRFLKDRLVRLGIPLAAFSWVLSPLFVYWFLHKNAQIPFWSFFPATYFSGGEIIGQGPSFA